MLTTYKAPPVLYHEPTRTVLARRVGRVGRVLFWIVMTAVVVLALLIFVVPRSQAGSGLTVLTGSMKPTYNPGDVVAVRGIKAHEVCDTVKPGDVVAFMPNADDPSTIITHRVIDVSDKTDYEDCTVTTQGDANNVADKPIPARAVKGVVMYGIPKVGYPLNALQQRTDVRLVTLGGALGFMSLTGLLLVPRRHKKHDPEWTI